MRIFLNNKEVVPSSETSISIVRENPIFTKSSDYSLEIEFPLSIQKNLLFFGASTHFMAAKATSYENAMIYGTHKLILKGRAVTTAITEKSVKLQFLADNAALNSDKGELYIDELDLGKIISYRKAYWDEFSGSWNDRPIDVRGIDIIYECELPNTFGSYLDLSTDTNTKSDYPALNYTPRNYIYFFPIVNSSNDEFMNELFVQTVPPYAGQLNRSSGIAPQWNFLKALQMIFTKIGLYYNLNCLNNTIAEKLVICNSTSTLDLAKALPHWTVNELLTEVENFLGISFFVSNNTITAHRLDEDYLKNQSSSELQKITQVLDEFEVTVSEEDDDDSQYVCNSNVGYDLYGDQAGYQKIDKEIYNKAFHDYYNSYKEAVQDVANKTQEINYATISHVNNNQYIYVGVNALWEVNYFRDISNNDLSEETDILLKIVPCNRVDKEIGFYNVLNPNIKLTGLTTRQVLSAEGGDNIYNQSTINDREDTVGNILVIRDSIENSLDKEETTTDIMPVAIWDNNLFESRIYVRKLNSTIKTSISARIPEPFTNNAVNSNDSFLYNRKHSLSLHSLIDTQTVGDFHESIIKINTKILYKIKFIAPLNAIDVKKAFLIGGKRYACRKITEVYDKDGLNKIIEGEFYMLPD